MVGMPTPVDVPSIDYHQERLVGYLLTNHLASDRIIGRHCLAVRLALKVRRGSKGNTLVFIDELNIHMLQTDEDGKPWSLCGSCQLLANPVMPPLASFFSIVSANHCSPYAPDKAFLPALILTFSPAYRMPLPL